MLAGGTSVERVRPESVKNSMAPDRSWLSMSVSEPSWLFREQLDLDPAAGGLLDPVRRLLRAHVHRVRDRRVVGEFIGELGRIGRAGADAEQRQRGGAEGER